MTEILHIKEVNLFCTETEESGKKIEGHREVRFTRISVFFCSSLSSLVFPFLSLINRGKFQVEIRNMLQIYHSDFYTRFILLGKRHEKTKHKKQSQIRSKASIGFSPKL